MRILIAGGSGYIGQHLARHLLRENHTVTVLGRNLSQLQAQFRDVASMQLMDWSALMSRDNPLGDYDVVINLCGANIGEKRWSDQRKQELIESRVQPTRTLAELCMQAGDVAPRLLNASAIGIYGEGFLAQIGHAWEEATACAPNVVQMRFAVVLSYDGGALKKMHLPFLLGLGGPIGDGNQPFTWISLTDLLNAISFIIAHPEISGPINLVAPVCMTQREFAKAFAHALHRPSFMITPAFMIKLIFQEMGEQLLLKGQTVYPQRLIDLGFKFKHPTIHSAVCKI